MPNLELLKSSICSTSKSTNTTTIPPLPILEAYCLPYIHLLNPENFFVPRPRLLLLETRGNQRPSLIMDRPKLIPQAAFRHGLAPLRQLPDRRPVPRQDEHLGPRLGI